MKYNTNSPQKVMSILLAIMFVIATIPSTLVIADDDSTKKVIRVGYMENYGVVKSPMVTGHEGYGYEYLRKMEEYIDYEFEFILCDWYDILDMLRSGEVDVVAPFRPSEERMNEFYFTEHIFAKEVILLISDDNYSLTADSYDQLNSANIGVREGGSSYGYLEMFIAENGLTPEILYFETTNFSKDIKKDEYDYLLTGSLQMEAGLNVALNLGTSNSYFMSRTSEIAEILDYAMQQIENSEYLFQEELQSKYFNHAIGSNIYISQDEFDLIQSKEQYDVGVINMYSTFGYHNESKIDNVSVDVLKFIANILSININYIEITSNTTKEELDKLDFYIYLNGYDTDLYENNSIPYMDDKLLLISNNNSTDNTEIGVLDYYSLDQELVDSLVDMDDVIYFSNARELITAFNDGEVSTVILADSVYQLLYELVRSTPHKILDLHYPILPTIIYTDEFPIEKIEIIDKAISYLTQDDIKTMLLNNMSLISAIEIKYVNLKFFYALLLVVVIIYILFRVYKNIKQKELDMVADYDRLTNLYTQQKFIKETRKLLDKNPNTSYTMYTFDIDNFKYINELYGFDVGDSILNIVGSFLKENLKAGFPVSRLSKDHFILITNTNSSLKEGKIDNNLNAALTERISDLVGTTCNIDYSIGLYFIEDIKTDVALMIDYCNLARSYSKDELGSVVTIYSDLMNQKEAVKNDIIYRMNNALKDREFVLYYQPKFDIETQEIVGAEALVRWFANGKMMPPNDFIPLFEKNGFIEKLDYYVLETTCKFIADNVDKKIPVISVNLSSITIMKSDVVDNIVTILDKYSLKTSQVELEITESAFVDQFEIALQRIDGLRSRGFVISMDDFGTGVSSLGRLKNMEIDVLKIDREFIIETLENDKSDVILSNIIKMANQLKLETVAEGIETKEQLGFLCDNGCKIGQGYYFARPLPENEFLQLL